MTKFISLTWLRIKKITITFLSPQLLYHFIRNGIVAGIEHKMILFKDLNTVVDIGANKGQFALATKFYTKSKVISFEPLEGPAKKFTKVFEEYDDVTLKEVAIGPRDEVRKINITNNDDSSSILEIGKLQKSIYDTEVVGTKEIQIRPLDSVINESEIVSPSLLKIDVQGFEKQVIEGSIRVINKFDYIYCECSYVELYKEQALASDIIDQLSTLGFKVCGIYNTYYENGKSIQSDILFQKI